jgi:hypothetical protein
MARKPLLTVLPSQRVSKLWSSYRTHHWPLFSPSPLQEVSDKLLSLCKIHRWPFVFPLQTCSSWVNYELGAKSIANCLFPFLPSENEWTMISAKLITEGSSPLLPSRKGVDHGLYAKPIDDLSSLLHFSPAARKWVWTWFENRRWLLPPLISR